MGEILSILTVLAACAVLGARLMLTAKRPVLRIAGGAFVVAAIALFGTLANCQSNWWDDDYEFAVRYAGPPKHLDSYFVIQTDQDGQRKAEWRRLNEQP